MVLIRMKILLAGNKRIYSDNGFFQVVGHGRSVSGLQALKLTITYSATRLPP
jgi:hypothetical protein